LRTSSATVGAAAFARKSSTLPEAPTSNLTGRL
jgi:hypothetical protein